MCCPLAAVLLSTAAATLRHCLQSSRSLLRHLYRLAIFLPIWFCWRPVLSCWRLKQQQLSATRLRLILPQQVVVWFYQVQLEQQKQQASEEWQIRRCRARSILCYLSAVHFACELIQFSHFDFVSFFGVQSATTILHLLRYCCCQVATPTWDSVSRQNCAHFLDAKTSMRLKNRKRTPKNNIKTDRMLLIHPLEEGELTRIKIGLKRLSRGGVLRLLQLLPDGQQNLTNRQIKERKRRIRWNEMKWNNTEKAGERHTKVPLQKKGKFLPKTVKIITINAHN